jgi:16S rRNA (adenine1518-N6/adenine1519-N6)-dimethyltransferase
MDLSNARELKALMQAHGMRPKHRLGQNFLIDHRVLESIVEGSGAGPDDLVLEIGPGLGTLTQRLAQSAGRVIAIELDRALIEILKKTLLPDAPHIELIHGDAGRIDLRKLLEDRLQPGQLGIVAANLPYYITTPLVMRLLEERLPLKQIVVMVQREVAERMISRPGGKEYGALSVAVQYYTEPSIVAHVNRSSFLPPPDVDSAVIGMKMRAAPPVDASRETFFRIVKASFGQRRKTLGNALAAGLDLIKEDVQAVLTACEIDPQRRGETLSLEEFAKIARAIDAKALGSV